MNKLLVICGPTATGKTELGISLAKKFEGEIVSADSRQVYKDMDIGTGKDLPKSAKFKIDSDILEIGNWKLGYYLIQGIKLWGYDLVSPKEEFSVYQYERIASRILADIWKREKLPTLVGGTGFYIKAVVDGIETSGIPNNKKLRQALKERSVDYLFEKLSDLDPVKAASLNQSDRKNPRRLTRAIEIAQWRLASDSAIDSESQNPTSQFPYPISTLFIGLKAPKKILHKRVKKRVEKRLNQGLLEEIGKLLANGVGWDDQSMQTIGYKEWKKVMADNIDLPAIRSGISDERNKGFDQVVDQWIKNEKNYAKRQMTWFKKDKRINWFDITQKNYEKDIEKLVDKWYSSSRK